MTESFEAIIFGDVGGAWTIVARSSTGSHAEGLGWARTKVQELAAMKTYRRFRTRVLSSTDEATPEGILRDLVKAAANRAAGVNCGPLVRAAKAKTRPGFDEESSFASNPEGPWKMPELRGVPRSKYG